MSKESYQGGKASLDINVKQEIIGKKEHLKGKYRPKRTTWKRKRKEALTFAMLSFEFVNEVVDQAVIEVLTTQVSVTGG